ncbi:MAG: hypothetical protein LUG60_06675 [Erysipelotrichaceae bacterium]|nr:hypothetical protein [Erysipelotrichaceae bacterium]
MHFVTGAFIACVCLAAAILFTEVFPKWFKYILALIGAFTSGYALAILIRRISELTSLYSEPKLWSTTGICTVVMLVVIIVVVTILHRKSKNQ